MRVGEQVILVFDGPVVATRYILRGTLTQAYENTAEVRLSIGKLLVFRDGRQVLASGKPGYWRIFRYESP